MELIIDPASSLMFESQVLQSRIMRDPPRHLQSRLFTIQDMIRSLFQGLLILVVSGFVFGTILKLGGPEEFRARTLTFSILIMSNLGLIFANMSGGSFQELKRLLQRPVNVVIALGIIFSLFVGIQVPSFARVFKLSPLKVSDMLISVGASLLIFMGVSFWNWMSQKKATFSN